MYGKDSDAGKDGGQEGKRVTEDEMVRSPCSPRDSKKSSASQFNSINSLVLSLLCDPVITSVGFLVAQMNRCPPAKQQTQV